MKKRIRDLWVAALRSGKYKRGQGYLRPSEDTYCCLGVLSDLYLEEQPGEWVLYCVEGGRWNLKLGNREEDLGCGLLPKRILRWAGVTRGELEIFEKVLPDMNDEGCSPCDSYDFNTIADHIERNL
jgi:hypothetical protein